MNARAWLRSRWLKRALVAIALLIAAPCIALLVAAAHTPLPAELVSGTASGTGAVLRDRHGVVMRELRAGDGTRARWIPFAELGEHARRAVLAAEDHRFKFHPGIDPIAIARAAGQLVLHRRIVSGASTITQQLARNLVPRPRTLRGKFAEAALALRIEWSLSKGAILEQYVNRVSFGPGLRGIESASRFYFDKPTRELSLAEAAAVAGMARGPAVYDPTRGVERLRRRRDRVLGRMEDAGLATREEVRLSLAEPLVIAKVGSGLGAPHLVRALMAGMIDERWGPMRNRTSDMTLTIDRSMQREIEILARATVHGLAGKHASAAAAVVIENATGEILAYVGSPDIEDVARLGQNDGVLALRQPGSTLKPFLYELAMERLGFTTSTLLPDIDLYLPGPDGDFHPNNYDGRFHGPVRLREALANSYNVPAVWTASAVGPDRMLTRLRELGMTSLREDAEHYGVGIALGDGEVRLLDLANAYATLARGGVWKSVSPVKAAIGKDGQAITLPARDERRVMDEGAAYVITHVLADPNARIASFGEGSVLELPFPTAVKTGTSKSFRDNYAVGFTPWVTVAVWAGNFDGSSMAGVSGVSGAGPLFHDAMIAAMRGRAAANFEAPGGRIEEAEVCALSGEKPTAACPHTRREVFAILDGVSHVPTAFCHLHQRVRVDRRNGLRARGCDEAEVEERTFERFDAQFTAWARSVGRAGAPDAYSPLCRGGPGTQDEAAAGRGQVRVAYPPDGTAFRLDPGAAGHQAIRLRADVPEGMTEVRFILDGHSRAVRAPFSLEWSLSPGSHRLRVEATTGAGDAVEFTVE